MQWHLADASDVSSLAEMNQHLISDEGHRNPMGAEQLRERMARWLATEYRAVIFERDGERVAYALYRTDEQERVHLRQFFVARPFRRRGVGREAFRLFRAEVIPSDRRVVLEVLITNSAARAFWDAVGFREYAVTLELQPD
jgi:ribosomal protein S18 acetylase RimI-like enzyme